MLSGIEIIKPADIESRSFAIITEMLGDKKLVKANESIIKRVIHTTADFDYADILNIHPDAVSAFKNAVSSGASIVTDTKMAYSGINKKSLESFGSEVVCFMSDDDIASEAKAKGLTRASLCMDKAMKNKNIKVYVIGNAPTALIRICELIYEQKLRPDLVIGVPVGFVNVIESKQLLKASGVPYIITEGRKGGSNVAAAIVNALILKQSEMISGV